jgi:AcrR family transcriptional regulator
MVQQERAARTRQSLIRAAAGLFARDGFAPASLSTISRLAGVSNGALHFHFENKSALAQAVEDAAAEAVRSLTETAARGGRGSLQVLVDATHELMGRLAEDDVVRAGFVLCADVARPGGGGLRRQWQQWAEDMLRRAEQEGRLAEGVSMGETAPVIVAATVGFEVLGGQERAWLSEESITRFWDLLLPRIAGRSELASVSSSPSVREEGAPGPGDGGPGNVRVC